MEKAGTIAVIDLYQTKDKPKHIVNSLEEFLIPGALAKLTNRIEDEKVHCAALASRAKPAKPKAKNKSKKSESKAAKAQAKREQKEAKKQLAELSQRLVVSLVKMIEEERLLKPAMSFPKARDSEMTGDLLDVVPSLFVTLMMVRIFYSTLVCSDFTNNQVLDLRPQLYSHFSILSSSSFYDLTLSCEF